MKTTLWMDGDDLVEKRTFDHTPYLESAAQLRSLGQTGSSELRHAARFDSDVVEQYCRTSGITLHEFMVNPVHVRRMLNDPALSGFRVWTGKVKRG